MLPDQQGDFVCFVFLQLAKNSGATHVQFAQNLFLWALHTDLRWVSSSPPAMTVVIKINGDKAGDKNMDQSQENFSISVSY